SIYNSYRRGISVDTLARRYQRTRNSMYRIVNDIRAQRLLDQPLDYIYNASFDDPGMADTILSPMPEVDEFESSRRSMRVPKDAPPELASLYEPPLLTKDQEQHLFRKMNFLKHQAHRLREQLLSPTGKINPLHARTQDLDRIEELMDEANAVKEQLISCN